MLAMVPFVLEVFRPVFYMLGATLAFVVVCTLLDEIRRSRK